MAAAVWASTSEGAGGSSSSSVTNVMALPDHCLIQIFRQLNLEDQIACRKVCRYWDELVRSNVATTKYIAIPGEFTKEFDRWLLLHNGIGLCQFQNATSMCPQLQQLTVNTTHALVEAKLFHILAESCPELRVLALKGVQFVVDNLSGNLTQFALPQLEELSLIDAALDDGLMKSLLDGCPKLRILDITGNSNVTDNAFLQCSLHLEKICITDCAGITGEVFKHLLDGSRETLTHIAAEGNGAIMNNFSAFMNNTTPACDVIAAIGQFRKVPALSVNVRTGMMDELRATHPFLFQH